MSELDDKRAGLTAEKHAKLKARLIDLLSSERPPAAFPRRTPGEPAPLSFAQNRLWFLAQLYPGMTAYNEAGAYRFHGRIDQDALRASLSAIVERHEILRTTFHEQDGIPLQTVGPPQSVPLLFVDLAGAGAETAPAAAQRRFRDVIEEPFDLGRDLMLRACLYRLHDEDHILLVVIHHIAADGWSRGLFWRELFERYRATLCSTPPELPDLPIQYADFALWQRDQLQGERLQKGLEYWRTRLADLPWLELPLDRSRPKSLNFQGGEERFTLPNDLIEKLRKLAIVEGTTLYMILLAAYLILLSRYTGQDDIATSTAAAGRNRHEFESLIGFFANTPLIRANLAGNPSFRLFLGQVRQLTLEAYDQQQIPFEKLLEELQPERQLDRGPLISNNFQLLDQPQPDLGIPGIGLQAVDVPNLHAKYDLECTLSSRADGLHGQWRYATDLFDSERIRRMSGHYQILLAGIAADPDCLPGRLPLLTEAEEEQIMTVWSGAASSEIDSSATLVHQLFEQQTERTPHRTAVVDEKTQLTYRQLNERANQVAYRLLAAGVGRETAVALCLDRSTEMIVGLLGILKAGAFYVPMNPHVPEARLRLLVEDAGIEILLSTSDFSFKGLADGLTQFCLDEAGWDLFPAYPNPATDVSSANLVYILHTSGSTGQPKGVMVEHRQLHSYLQAAVDQFGMSAGGSFALLLPLTFDASQTVIFTALGWGGTLHIISHERALDATALSTYFQRHPIDFLKITPTFMQALLAGGDSASLLPRRALIFGGEVLHWGLVDKLLDIDPTCKIWNHYGPTEATVAVAVCLANSVRETDRSLSATVPLGPPLAGAQLFILDRFGNPVPAGVEGEIFIGGSFVSRGYLKKPEQTNELFREDFLRGSARRRLYRSGDRARFLPGGLIEFLGRRDDQVKVRGIRIELGEITAVLGSHPHVEECAVLLRQDVDSEPRLVAYAVAKAGAVISAEDIDRFLRARLPAGLVPTAVVIMDSMPRTAHDKVDRAALPPPQRARAYDPQIEAGPRSTAEEKIAAIWSELFALERIGLQDNFFELGGYSLMAARVISRLAIELQIAVPLRTIFDNPTIATLAAAVTQKIEDEGNQAETAGPSLHSPDAMEPHTLSFGQQRLWFFNQLQPENPMVHTVRVFRIHGPLNIPILEESLQALSHRHTILRTIYPAAAGVPTALIRHAAAAPILHVENLSAPLRLSQEEAAVERVRREIERPYHLAGGPLFRALLLELSAEDQILCLGSHQIVLDNYSWPLLMRELGEFYKSFAANETASLPPLKMKYSDYVSWQRSRMQSETAQRQMKFWRQLLAGIQPLDLPLDRPRPPLIGGRGAAEPFFIPPHLLGPLNTLSAQEGATLFVTLLAAFNALLYRYTGQSELIVGTSIANRRLPETEAMVGFFANMIALPVEVSGDRSFRELLQQVRQTALAAYDHSELPFEKLIEELDVECHLDRTPIFQVLFSLHDAPGQALTLPGIAVTGFEVQTELARFDLELDLTLGGDGVSGQAIYNTDIFLAATIKRFIESYEVLLAGILENPELPIDRLSILSPAEKARLLTLSRGAIVPEPEHDLLRHYFDPQVITSPDRIAVIDGDFSLTYRELDEDANRLAHYLIDRGVAAGDTVGICMARSHDLISAILAIIKTGAAYLPLDPAYPQSRLRYMIDNADAKLLLLHDRTSAVLEDIGRPVIDIDREREMIGQEPNVSPEAAVNADNTLYLIFTSGSSGQPKGVPMSHRALLNLIQWHLHHPQLKQPARTLQFAPASYDVSTKDIFITLAAGGTLITVSEEIRRNPQALLDFIAGSRVQRMFLPYVALSGLATAAKDQDWAPDCVEDIICGGEPLVLTEDIAWFMKTSGAKLHNQYGSTEDHSITSFTLPDQVDNWPATAPIGKVIDNAGIYLLDASGNLLPQGCTGEVYANGPGFAFGYLHLPQLTAETIIYRPDLAPGDGRLRRTGDIARLLPDGSLFLAGRKDLQVKYRGFRIEPGEIEYHLRAHPAVHDAVVLLSGTVEKAQLSAYIVPLSKEVDRFLLQEHLRQRLPPHMLPGRYLQLDAFPLTPSGKIDRASLLAANFQETAVHGQQAAPRTPEEAALLKIWRELLDREQVSIHDNFFELGGHSLMAMQIALRIKDQWEINVPLTAIFNRPILAGLAETIAEKRIERQIDIDENYEELIL